MNSDLTIYDMDNFINKYTKFITKDIYISNKLYSNFLNQYTYLYQTLKKDYFLYNNNKKYQKIINIFENKKNLVKLHNQKYLNNSLKKYQSLYKENNLDILTKKIILLEEENTYIVNPKNKITLIVLKIIYLIKYKNYQEKDIIVLTKTKEEQDKITKECLKNNINPYINTLSNYQKKLLSNQEILLDNNQKYNILIKYIMEDLFPNKSKFSSFKEAFSKYIYLNKDYKEYETFKDYHNYMYKRKYLSSKLTLKQFTKQEINTRKKYLRTIQNETMPTKELVSIANFLYLNSCPYTYNQENNTFTIKHNNKKITIKYLDKQNQLQPNKTKEEIELYSSYKDTRTYLEVLAYELIKRRYPLELINDETIYNKLKNTNIDNYFSELINKYLIPLINYYENTYTLDKINISTLEKKEFLSLYKDYTKYIKENNYITDKVLKERIELNLDNSSYKYLFLLDSIPLNFHKKTMTIISNYQETELIKENIKLLYDYKKYLLNNQTIPIPNTYISKTELNNLTKNFLKDNLAIINKSLENNKKEILIYEYNDTHRLHIYPNISKCCSNILTKESKNTIIALNQIKDINLLIDDNLIKYSKNTLKLSNNTKIKVEEILKIDKLYDTIILPFIIKDKYHDDLFLKNNHYNTKVTLYIALTKCRSKVIIICPTSKKEELNQLLGNLKNKTIKS